MRWLVALVIFLTLVGYVHSARADVHVDMHATVDPQVVEVGEPFAYRVDAMVDERSAPTDPQPGALGRIQIRGVQKVPITREESFNGVRKVTSGLVTVWSLVADKEGTFTLGPGSVVAGGSRRTAPPVKVKVVPRGKGPKRADPLGSPLGPFAQMFDLNDDDFRRAPEPPPVDASLNLPEARSPISFLHARVDKTRAVVGEQVTLTVLMYEDTYARPGQPKDVHEANTPDFLKRSLSEDDMASKTLGFATIGERQWRVTQIRKNALFPMKTGKLRIDPMSITLPSARVGLRESEILEIDVTEPPVAGRPPGWVMGDVGDFSLSAIVAPRAIKQEGAVGINIELRGTGNLPEKIPVPVATGVEWLEAQTTSKVGDAGQDRFGGTRTFSYVVRLHKSGSIDLGEIKIPFYDPVKRAYGVARAGLGIIEVEQGTARAQNEEVEKVLEGLPGARSALDGAGAQSFIAERPVYWGLLFGAPALCGIFVGADRLRRRSKEKREAHEASPEKQARDRRREADDACKGTDGSAALGAITRAIVASVLASTGVNVKGAAAGTVRSELEEAGVKNADAIMKLLREIEDARFSPDGVSIETARSIWKRAQAEISR